MRSRKIFILLILLKGSVLLGQIPDSLKSKQAEKFLFSKKNSINFEAFGHGLYYSFSYEKIFINGYHNKLGVQAGISVYPYSDQIDLWFPVSINFLRTVGLEGKHHLEFGAGHVLRYDQTYGYHINYPYQTFFTAKIGYRFQKPSGPWIFKILFTPFYEYDARNNSHLNPNFDDKRFFYPSGALSIGYSF